MSVALRTITRLQDADDINVSLGAGVDEYALTWDNDTSKFVLRQVAGVYLLATGATTGATSQAQAFTNGVVVGTIKPPSDGVTAILLRNASASVTVLGIDTTNKRVGVGPTAPACTFHVAVAGIAYGLWESTDGSTDWLGFFASGAFGPAIYWKSSNSLRFIRTDNNLGTTTTYEVARFTSGGLFGIGTTAPATRLDIDAGAMTMAEMTAPTGVANKAILYTKDNGSGKTQLCCKLGNDVEIVIATQA